MSNVEIPQARTITLSDRTDGTTKANRPAYIRPGEVLLFAIDCVAIAGDFIEGGADSVAVVAVGTPGGVLVATLDSVRESLAILLIDATGAHDGDAWTITFRIHPTAAQSIRGEVGVVCEDD